MTGDMRGIPYENEFDGVTNIFTAFGYFEEERKNFKVIQGVARALKKGGKFLLETINREWILRNLRTKDWEEIDQEPFALDERKLDLPRSRIRSRTLFIREGKRKERSHSLRLYTLREMPNRIEESGLQMDSTLGGLDGREYSHESKRMVILAVKRRSHERR